MMEEKHKHSPECIDPDICDAAISAGIRMLDLAQADEEFTAHLEKVIPATSLGASVWSYQERLDAAFIVVVEKLAGAVRDYRTELASEALMRSLTRTSKDATPTDSDLESVIDRAIRKVMEQAGKPAEEE